VIAAPTSEAIAQAVAILKAGGLIGLPTETVYGLAADAANGDALAAVFALKGRPRFNPLIAHVADRAAAEAIAVFDPLAARLADAFWPGPLTLVLPRRPGSVHDLATAGLETVAVRVPAHPVARSLLAAFGGPVAAPSANRSGHVSPTTAAHVDEAFGEDLALVLDGGPCDVGLESTVVATADGRAAVLRPGGLARGDIEAITGPLAAPGDGTAPSSPGQLLKHYAPAAPVRLDATEALPGEVLIGFGAVAGDLTLSATGDVREAAANLFAALRAADARRPTGIAVATIPMDGLGEAIHDRLVRAARGR
jgi:L-threonylcarbamoyladenylate synthase